MSYFRLKLENYLGEHFPELLNDKSFVAARAEEALTAYCDAVAQGFTHPEAEAVAGEMLFQGLHFSKYDTLTAVFPKNSLRYFFATKRCSRSLPNTTSRTTLPQARCTRSFTPNSRAQLCLSSRATTYPRLAGPTPLNKQIYLYQEHLWVQEPR